MLLSCFRRLSSVVCCLLSGVWCLVSGVWCLVSGVWCVFYFGTRCPVPEAPRRVATGFSLWSKFMLSAIFTLEQVTILEIDAVPI